MAYRRSSHVTSADVSAIVCMMLVCISWMSFCPVMVMVKVVKVVKVVNLMSLKKTTMRQVFFLNH